MVSLDKRFETVTELKQDLGLCADDHSEESLGEEALRGESQAVLLGEELLAEVDVVLDVLEIFRINLNHHVHGGATLDRFDSVDFGQALEGSL